MPHASASVHAPAGPRPAAPANARTPAAASAGVHGRVLALQRAVGNQAVAAVLRPPAPPTVSAAGGAVVQRAVGFEFETGWLVWDQTAQRQWHATNGQARYEPEPPPLPLAKKDVVHTGSGFRVEADEAANSESELEFVVDPPVPATAAGRESLFERMTYMTLLGARLLRAGAGGARFTLDAATGDAGDDRFLIQPNDEELVAGPQVTAGISLEAVSRIATTRHALPHPLGQTKGVAQAVNLEMADQYLPQQLWPMKPELKGLLTVMAPYLWSGERAVLYPKQITDSFLLSRTDFSALFKLLPQEDRAYLAKYPIAFMQLALAAAGLETDALDVPVIQRVWTNEDYEAVRPVGPTRRKWLTMITMGYDLLSSRHYRELAGYYEDSPDEARLGDDLESLGELGGKTEKVGTAQRDAGIFEFRGAGPSRRRIPLLQWEPFTDEMMRYLMALEG
jgi:hypothetical protein